MATCSSLQGIKVVDSLAQKIYGDYFCSITSKRLRDGLERLLYRVVSNRDSPCDGRVHEAFYCSSLASVTTGHEAQADLILTDVGDGAFHCDKLRLGRSRLR